MYNIFFVYLGVSNNMEDILRICLPLLRGTRITLVVFFATLIFSLPLGFLFAIGRISKVKTLSKSIEIYSWIMRGSPLMLQLFFVYFVLPRFGVLLPDIVAVLLAFSLNYAAYFSEIFRAGIQSIPKGQYEAAKALGFNQSQMLRRIILPQMIKRVIPPISNETITLVKDTSLVYVLAMNDLLREARTIVQREFTIMPFFVAVVFYLAMTYIVTRIFAHFEAHYARYQE